MYILPLAAFPLLQEGWVAATDTIWQTKSEIFTTRGLPEEGSLIYSIKPGPAEEAVKNWLAPLDDCQTCTGGWGLDWALSPNTWEEDPADWGLIRKNRLQSAVPWNLRGSVSSSPKKLKGHRDYRGHSYSGEGAGSHWHVFHGPDTGRERARAPRLSSRCHLQNEDTWAESSLDMPCWSWRLQKEFNPSARYTPSLHEGARRNGLSDGLGRSLNSPHQPCSRWEQLMSVTG